MTKVAVWFSRGLGQISGVYTATFIFLRPKQKYKRKGKYTELALNLIEKNSRSTREASSACIYLIRRQQMKSLKMVVETSDNNQFSYLYVLNLI